VRKFGLSSVRLDAFSEYQSVVHLSVGLFLTAGSAGKFILKERLSRIVSKGRDFTEGESYSFYTDSTLTGCW
jgi:hypothetical protein